MRSLGPTTAGVWLVSSSLSSSTTTTTWRVEWMSERMNEWQKLTYQEGTNSFFIQPCTQFEVKN